MFPESPVVFISFVTLVTLEVALSHVLSLMLHKVRHGLGRMAAGFTFE